MCQLMRDIHGLEEAAPLATPARYKTFFPDYVVSEWIRYSPGNRLIYDLDPSSGFPAGTWAQLWSIDWENLGVIATEYEAGTGFDLVGAQFSETECYLVYQKLDTTYTAKLAVLDLTGALQREATLFEDEANGITNLVGGKACAFSYDNVYLLTDDAGDYIIKICALSDGEEQATFTLDFGEVVQGIAYTQDHLYICGVIDDDDDSFLDRAVLRSYTTLGTAANTTDKAFTHTSGTGGAILHTTQDYVLLYFFSTADSDTITVYDSGLVEQYETPGLSVTYADKVPPYTQTLTYSTSCRNTLICQAAFGGISGFLEWRVGETEWFTYTLDTKASIGAEPDLDALNDQILSAEIAHDIRRAIERLAPAYENPDSEKPWNVFATDPLVSAEFPIPFEHTNNLLYQVTPAEVLEQYGVFVDDPAFPKEDDGWSPRVSWTRGLLAEGHVVRLGGIAYVCINPHFSTEDNLPIPGATKWAIYKGPYSHAAPQWKAGYYYRPARDLVEDSGTNWVSIKGTNHWLAGVEGQVGWVNPGTDGAYWREYFTRMFDGSPGGFGTAVSDTAWIETLDPKGGPYPLDIDFGEMRLCIDRLMECDVFE